jgi:hypothetical protein
MVRIVLVSEYISNPPDEANRTKIAGGPLYELARVQSIVASEDGLNLWTTKCIKDVGTLFDHDLDRVVELIQALKPVNYVDSEWCGNGKNALAACDAYRIQRREIIAATGKEMTIEYFLKFAIGKTGRLVLMVSCHLGGRL